MKKLLATLACAAMVAIPSAANAADTDTATGVAIGGNYGPAPCYVTLDYFWVTVTVDSQKPFVHESHGGSIGGEVHCPLISWGE